jgi:hypothetical protein
MKLRYIDDGSFFPGVPAADHDCEDDKEAQRLVASGLYAYVKEPRLPDLPTGQAGGQAKKEIGKESDDASAS